MDDDEKQALKLVLKVGGEKSGAEAEVHHKSKKRKKKKHKKDRDHEHKKSRLDEDRPIPDAVRRLHDEYNPESDVSSPVSASNSEERVDSDYDVPAAEDEVEVAVRHLSGKDVNMRSTSDDSKRSRLEREAEDWLTRRENKRPDALKSPLQQCLLYLHGQIQKKDVNDFFANPVTDAIAPGYSTFIKKPMDFATMRNKIEAAEYTSIPQYWEDVKLVCENAMSYNGAETIYYKEADKILAVALKLISKDRLIALRRSFTFVRDLSAHELGFDPSAGVTERLAPVDVAIDSSEVVQQARKRLLDSKRQKNPRFEAVADNVRPSVILRRAQIAAQEAASRVEKSGVGKMGYVRQRQDGTKTLKLLSLPFNGKAGSERLIKEAAPHSAQSTTYKPPRSMDAINSLLTSGSFSARAPRFMSLTSSLTEAEHEMLLSAYSGDVGQQYALSTKRFASGSGEYVTRLVDGMLNILSGSNHDTAWRKYEQMEQSRVQAEVKDEIKDDFQLDEGLPLLTQLGVSATDGAVDNTFNLTPFDQKSDDSETDPVVLEALGLSS